LPGIGGGKRERPSDVAAARRCGERPVKASTMPAAVGPQPSWGYMPSGGLGLIVIILLILVLTGHL
jgi:Protein of unknown function (DUF3309)